jgi:hypothetical protein
MRHRKLCLEKIVHKNQFKVVVIFLLCDTATRTKIVIFPHWRLDAIGGVTTHTKA